MGCDGVDPPATAIQPMYFKIRIHFVTKQYAAARLQELRFGTTQVVNKTTYQLGFHARPIYRRSEAILPTTLRREGLLVFIFETSPDLSDTPPHSELPFLLPNFGCVDRQ